jgi:5S rRNA maturation endonuclease (ribonuclease M5)
VQGKSIRPAGSPPDAMPLVPRAEGGAMTATAMDTLRALSGFKACGENQYEARCPGHEDNRASLSIGKAPDGKILLDCKAGCKTIAILESMGLSMKDLFPSNGNGGNGHKPESKIVETYDYCDADGKLSYQVVRFDPKDFRQRKPDGNGGYIWKASDLKRLPYRLQELLQAEYVFIVEGEKDCESLRKIGLVGTCIAGGAKSPDWPTVSQYFRKDQHVTIIPDNDEPGETYAQNAAAALSGKVASVKVLKLSGLPDKGDVSDWLQGKDAEAAAEELSRLSDAAPEWEPPKDKDEKPTGFQPPAHWELLDVADVDSWTCAPLEWIIEDIAAKGNLIFVAADSQCGKTLLALYIVLHMLHGGDLFGKFKINPPKKVLYLLLEDPTRRAKQRILDMRRAIRIGHDRFLMYVAPGLTVNDDLVWVWLKGFIADNGFDFVVLDTYQKATPGISSFDDIKQGPILHRLANLTRELNVTLWIHDHYRKDGGGKKRKELDPSSMKGTGGKPQNADCYILMERSGDMIKVAVSSKDSDRHPRFMLQVSPEGSGEEKFQYAGDLENAANDMRQMGENNRQRILDSFPTDGSWITRSFIEGATGLKTAAVKKHLQSLQKDKSIECNGKSGKAIGYRIGHAETTLWPNAASDIDTED